MMVLALGWASPARAQQKELLPPWVVDVRGVFAKLGQDEVTAADLSIAATALPGTAIGAAIGVNVYPLRRQKLSLGIGGEGLLSRAVSTPTDAAGTVTGARVERRFRDCGTVSLNFGHRQGWSYVSGGLGPVRFQTFSGDPAARSAAVRADRKLRRGRAVVHQPARRVLLRPALLSHQARAGDGHQPRTRARAR